MLRLSVQLDLRSADLQKIAGRKQKWRTPAERWDCVGRGWRPAAGLEIESRHRGGSHPSAWLPQSADAPRPPILKFQTGEEQVYGPEASDLLLPWPQWPLFLVGFAIPQGRAPQVHRDSIHAWCRRNGCHTRGALGHPKACQVWKDSQCSPWPPPLS